MSIAKAGRPKDKEITLARYVDNLHSSLDIHTIIEHFHQLLAFLLPVDGVKYQHLELNLAKQTGELNQHQSCYELKSDGMNLGHVVVARDKKFLKRELQQIDKCLQFLYNPLKNAIVHRRAVYSAMHDPLTSLLNRSSLAETLTREVNRASRYDRDLSLILLDIDDFKLVNDKHGHAVGDKILRQTAMIISVAIRETDFAFRIGGEEFLIILPNTSQTGGKKLAERLRSQVECAKDYHSISKLPPVTVSIGFACYDKGETIGHFFARTDKALYQAKARGKNTIVYAK